MGSSTAMPGVLASTFEQIASVEDVFVMGYVDREPPEPVFQLFPTVAFLQADRGYLRMDAQRLEGQLYLARTNEIDLDEKLLDEPTIEPMVGRLTHLYFGENTSLGLLGVTCYADEFSRPDERMVRAVEFHLEFGNSLFVDPAWSLGIRLGGRAMADEWRREDENRQTAAMSWLRS